MPIALKIVLIMHCKVDNTDFLEGLAAVIVVEPWNLGCFYYFCIFLDRAKRLDTMI